MSSETIHEVAVSEPQNRSLAGIDAGVSVDALLARIKIIADARNRAMVPNVHYGVIPGTDKPTLLQPGAQLLCQLFGFIPEFSVRTNELREDHREEKVTCTLKNRAGEVVAQGLGSCSTMEKKYRWRNGNLVCPECGKDTIRKSKDKAEFYCWRKIGGCGKTFNEDAKSITSQVVGRVENTDIADVYNTVLKIGMKRALVSATITATAASDSFTQDMEDMQHEEQRREPEPQRGRNREPAPEQQPRKEKPSNGNHQRPIAPKNGTDAYREFFDEAANVVDPEQYGEAFPVGMSDVWKWANESGAMKDCGFPSMSAMMKSEDRDAFKRLFELLELEAQSRLDRITQTG